MPALTRRRARLRTQQQQGLGVLDNYVLATVMQLLSSEDRKTLRACSSQLRCTVDSSVTKLQLPNTCTCGKDRSTHAMQPQFPLLDDLALRFPRLQQVGARTWYPPLHRSHNSSATSCRFFWPAGGSELSCRYSKGHADTLHFHGRRPSQAQSSGHNHRAWGVRVLRQ